MRFGHRPAAGPPRARLGNDARQPRRARELSCPRLGSAGAAAAGPRRGPAGFTAAPGMCRRGPWPALAAGSPAVSLCPSEESQHERLARTHGVVWLPARGGDRAFREPTNRVPGSAAQGMGTIDATPSSPGCATGRPWSDASRAAGRREATPPEGPASQIPCTPGGPSRPRNRATFAAAIAGPFRAPTLPLVPSSSRLAAALDRGCPTRT